MAEHPNVALVRKGYEAFAKGDIATLTELFAENVVWHVPGNMPFSGEHRGRQAVFAAFGRFAEVSGGTYRFELHDILANDEHAVALGRSTASRQGRQLSSLDIEVYHVSNGKATEIWSFVQDVRKSEEFWS
jgi:ketosteroid isomerase-like protein